MKAEVRGRRVHVLDGRKKDGFVASHGHPFEFAGVLNVEESLRETCRVMVSVGCLPVKLHFPLLSQSQFQFPHSKIFRPTFVTNYDNHVVIFPFIWLYF